MRDHVLRTAMTVPRPRPEVFAFFENADNLEAITPAEMGFAILTPRPIVLGAGALIDYRLRIWGIPVRWRTRIAAWAPPDMFVDEQLAGPYALWVHTHRFSDAPGGATRIEDEVRYRLPLWPVGELGAPLVQWQLARIFDYRRRRVHALLGPEARASKTGTDS